MPDRPEDCRPLIAHVIFRLGVGGLENGLVNLINAMSGDRFRHAILCVKDSTAFAGRIRRADVRIQELHKRDGKDPRFYLQMWRTLRRIAPDIVHTRNANTLEYQLLAAFGGVRGRIHGEHGWDLHDLHGTSRKYRFLRRGLSPLVNHFITVSADLEAYLVDRVGVNPVRVTRIYNGVDTTRFRPRVAEPDDLPDRIAGDDRVIVGTVGRMQEVKNQPLLARAFLRILEAFPDLRSRLRLVFVGDGPLATAVRAELDAAGASELVWMAGERDDVPSILSALDIFVLPSLNEGISNTVLEAMATGLPVVATAVGGTPEIVSHGRTGLLVDSGDVEGMANAIRTYADNPEMRALHGAAARQRAVSRFSLDRMVEAYRHVYDSVLQGKSMMRQTGA